VDGQKGNCRGAAALALGRTGHPTAAPFLLPLLESAPFDVRPSVALGLGFLGRATHDKTVTDALAKAIEKNTTNEAMSAALCLACGLAGVESARPRLAQFASDRKAPTVSAYATFALALVGAGPEERKVLHDVVARLGDFTASREAALALGMLRDRSVVEQLRTLLSDRAAADVDRATWAICLGRVGDDTDVDFLLGVLGQAGGDDQFRACVLNAVGRLVDEPEGAAVGHLVADSLSFGLIRSGQAEAIRDLQHLID
jgi:HEAT repeat protein